MDFANEEYRRLYVRDTITWKRLGWEGQCVLMQILRKMDRSGVLELGGLPPADAVALAVGTEVSNVDTGLGRILHLEVLKHSGDSLVWPKFVEAQTVNKTDKQRQRESRDRRRSTSLGTSTRVTPSDNSESHKVTNGHAESHAVTDGHTRSHAVTHSSAQQSSTQQSKAELAQPRDAREISAEAKRGIDWYTASVLSGDPTQLPDVHSWRADYAAIGRKSPADREAVSRHIAADRWVQANKRAVDPAHFVKHWQRYAAGGRKTVETEASSAEQAQAAKAASVASRAKAARDDFNARIHKAKAEGDTYTADILAAERDHVVSRIQAKAS
jgi:hypothetical protein